MATAQAASLAPAPKPSAKHDEASQHCFSAGYTERQNSFREPSLNFDGMAAESVDVPLASPSTTAPRSMRSYTSLAEESVSGSVETRATSQLPPLQTKGLEDDDDDDENALRPLCDEDLDPRSFDLVAPMSQPRAAYSLERRSDLLFSGKHMGAILADSVLLRRFSQFLSVMRPASVPLLTYYLHTEKALRAIQYANAVTSGLTSVDGHDFSRHGSVDTINETLAAQHNAAFEALTRDELPMFITHVWIQVVSVSMRRRITGTMPAHLREASEGLAEVFCLTDPSRHDNPIILASDEFHRTTQYGINYAIGRNCRFLQGPGTNPFSVKRIRDRLAAGKEHYETFLNYRRDGSPFLNLLMCAPLIDSRGKVRYFLGAQVDVSGLAKDCTDLEGLRRIVTEETASDSGRDAATQKNVVQQTADAAKDPSQCCRDLSEMFDRDEVEMVRRHGGVMHQTYHHDDDDPGKRQTKAEGGDNWNRPYMVIEDGSSSPELSPQPTNAVPEFQPSTDVASPRDNDHHSQQQHQQQQPPPPPPSQHQHHSSSSPHKNPSGRLAGSYEHYLLVRPSSSLQILFASPSLRVPGMLQSPFLSRIGGSGRVRTQISDALAQGQGVTAKVRWLSSPRRQGEDSDRRRGRPRWIHCTPLRGVNNAIGVWMVVIVDEEGSEGLDKGAASQGYSSQKGPYMYGRQPKFAPPIKPTVSSKPLPDTPENERHGLPERLASSS